VLYEETSLIFLGLVLVSHAAFAVLCGAGFVGVSLLVFSWLYFGRVLGRFAIAKEVRKILHAVREEYSQESPDQQIEIAEQMLQTRIEDVRSL
jgi:NADH:ubiquinone oxidoreductase subunit 6 (subunit J)